MTKKGDYNPHYSTIVVTLIIAVFTNTLSSLVRSVFYGANLYLGVFWL